AYKEKTFEVRAAGDGIPLASIQSVRDLTREIEGRLSFEVSGSGPLAKPNLTIAASLANAVFFGHTVPAGSEPRLALKITSGAVDGKISVPEKASIAARGAVSATPATLDVDADVPDLATLLLFTPLALPPGEGGSVAGHGRVAIPTKEGEKPSGELVLTRLRLDARDRPDLIRSEGDVRARFVGGRITVDEMRAVGDGID